MFIYIAGAGLLFLLLFFMPKLSTGRILYTESFVPVLQSYCPLIKRDLRHIPVQVEIVTRKLYRIKALSLLKPVFELLPSSYSVTPNKNGSFVFWAYPFDVVNIIVGEDNFRETYTLRHKVNNFWPKYANFILALSSLLFPKLLHGESIEIPTTLGKTCGYSDKLSTAPGEDLELMISTKAKSLSLELVRVGEKLVKVEEVLDIPGTYQDIKTKFPSALGCGWTPSLKYRIPEDAGSGCYIIKLAGTGKDDVSFIPVIVKPVVPRNEIAVIASTNTWHAYNSWGGQNYYINYTSFPSRYILSTQRPFDLYVRNTINDTCQKSRDHLLVGERFIWSWMERENIGYDLYSDTDLHSEDVYSSLLKKYKIIIISTHNEYWSYEMIKHLDEYIKGGGRVLSLSGNTLYKEIEYVGDGIMVLDGALFRDQGYGEESILGVAHDTRGFTTWAPYSVVKSDHWVFENTNLKNGDLIGSDGLNVSPTEQPGASGWETDKIHTNSPDSAVLLAKGINSKQGGADLIIYDVPGGGSVFSVSSITYGGSLLVDDNISRITKNVISRFLT